MRTGTWLALACCLLAAPVAADHHAEQPPSLEDVYNYHRIDDQLVTAGQIAPAHVPLLRDAGVELIVNLAVADPGQNRDEAFAVAEAASRTSTFPSSGSRQRNRTSNSSSR